MKKSFIFLLTLLLSVTLFANGGDEKKAETNEELTLHWLQGGPGVQRDFDMVMVKANEVLAGYVPNTKIDMEIVIASEIKQRFDLMMAASEPVDIAWKCWTQNLGEEVNKGSYLPLDELIDENAPAIREAIPSWLLEAGLVNGQQYIIPKYEMSFWQLAVYTPKDEFEAAFDVDSWKKAVDSADSRTAYKSTTSVLWDAMENYMVKLQDMGMLESGFSPWVFRVDSGRELVRGAPNWTYNMPSVGRVYYPGEIWDFTVQNTYEMPETIEMFERYAKWREMGFIREDMMSLQNPREYEKAEPNGYDIWFHGYRNTEGGDYSVETGRWAQDHVLIPIEKYPLVNPSANDGMVIPRTAQDPARSMKVLNLVESNEGKDFYNMLAWGLEGVHYKKVSDIRIETLDYTGQGNAESPYGLWKWALGNVHNSYLTQGDASDNLYEYFAEMDASGIQDPYSGFVLDDSMMVNELAQIRSVMAEYVKAFMCGYYTDAKYTEFLEKLNKAGTEKVNAEVQKQVNAFLTAKGIPLEGYVFNF